MKNNNKSVVTPNKESDVQRYVSDEKSVVDTSKLCPAINQKAIMAQLPEIVKRVLKPITDNIDKYPKKCYDIVLAAVITAYSSILGRVRINYNNAIHSLNISTVIVGHAASNKSLMSIAFPITELVDQAIVEESQAEIKEWEKKNFMWERELEEAKKKKREPDWNMNPGDKPAMRIFNMPATTSKSMLTQMLEACNLDGLLMRSTEINSLACLFAKQYGDIADTLCKATENETPDQMFKVDGKRIGNFFPMLSLLISGTYDQYDKLFPNMVDGLVSRFCVILADVITEWNDQRPTCSSDNIVAHRTAVKESGLNVWQWQRQFERIEVTFTDAQWDRHTQFWTETFNDFILNCDMNISAIPKRHGSMEMRIAAVLTVLRYYEEKVATGMAGGFNGVIECTDADFKAAELIVNTYHKHVLALATTRKDTANTENKEMSDWHWVDNALTKAYQMYGDEPFTTQQFANVIAAEPFNKAKSTAYRTVEKLHRMGILKPVKKKKPTKYKIQKAHLRKICK